MLPRKCKKSKFRVIQTSGASQAYFRIKSSTEILDQGKLFVYGGFDTDDILDSSIYLLDLATGAWEARYNEISREGHSTNYLRPNEILVLGGVPADEGSDNELQKSEILIYNISEDRWRIPEQQNLMTMVQRRSRHATCLDGDRLFVSGGYVDQELSSDLYYYDMKDDLWFGPFSFVQRFDHCLMYHNHKIWSFGGLDKSMNYISSGVVYYFDLDTFFVGSITIYNEEKKLVGDHVYLPLATHMPAPKVLDITLPYAKEELPSFAVITLSSASYQRKAIEHEKFGMFVWKYPIISHDSLYLLGSPRTDHDLEFIDYKLTDLLKIDLRQLGVGPEPARHSSLSIDMELMLGDTKFSDFEIVAVQGTKRPGPGSELVFVESGPYDGKTVFMKSAPVPVHLAILAARWPYFSTIVSSGMAEAREKTIFIQEPASWVNDLIYFLYTDRLPAHDDVLGLLVLAHYYNLTELFTRVLARLGGLPMTPKLSLQVFQTSLQLDDEDFEPLKAKALRYIAGQWGRIVGSSYLADEMTREELVLLLQSTSMETQLIDGKEQKLRELQRREPPDSEEDEVMN